MDLPGADIVRRGIADLAKGVVSVPSLLVSMAPSRLHALGIEVTGAPIAEPEARLFELLEQEWGNGAHSKYNALRRQLVSFMRAVPCVRS